MKRLLVQAWSLAKEAAVGVLLPLGTVFVCLLIIMLFMGLLSSGGGGGSPRAVAPTPVAGIARSVPTDPDAKAAAWMAWNRAISGSSGPVGIGGPAESGESARGPAGPTATPLP